MIIMYSDNDFRLYHHGVKNQKWYVRNGPPYPLDSSISTGKSLKVNRLESSAKFKETAGKIKAYKAKRAAEKAEKAEEARKKATVEEEERRKQAEKEEKERVEREEAQHEAEKQAAIKSGDATKVEKFKSEMSLQELNEAVQRVNLNRQISQSMPKEPSKIDKAISALDKTKTTIEKGIGYWNSFAKIYNSFNEEPLPIIDGQLANKIAEKNKKDREEEIYKLIRANTIKPSDQSKQALDNVLKSMTNSEVEAMDKRLKNEKNIKNFDWNSNTGKKK